MPKKIFYLLSLLLLSAIFVGCGKGTSVSEPVRSTVYNSISNINTNYVPGPLKKQSTTASLSNLTTQSVSNFEEFLSLQPSFLQSYLATSQAFFEGLVEYLKTVEDYVGIITNGSGSRDLYLGNLGSFTVIYNKSSDSVYSFLLQDKTTNKYVFYLNVDEKKYTVILDGNSLGESGTSGYFKAVIDYTNENVWTNTIFITDMAKNTQDLNIPERMKIIIQKENTLWKGKVMTYHPYATPPTSTSASKNVYTEFVSDTATAKCNIYFLACTVSDISDLSKYALSEVGKNYPEYIDSSFDITKYSNPVCIKSDYTMIWNASASDFSQSVATANFLADTLWIAPSNFKNVPSVSVPENL